MLSLGSEQDYKAPHSKKPTVPSKPQGALSCHETCQTKQTSESSKTHNNTDALWKKTAQNNNEHIGAHSAYCLGYILLLTAYQQTAHTLPNQQPTNKVLGQLLNTVKHLAVRNRQRYTDIVIRSRWRPNQSYKESRYLCEIESSSRSKPNISC